MEGPELEITSALVSAYSAYALSDRLGFSGVLAPVAAGLYARRSSDCAIGPMTRIESASFWGVVTFLLESMLFLLIGLQLPELIGGGGGVGGARAIGYGAAIAAVAIVIRLVWMFTVPYISVGGRRRREDVLPSGERAVLGWAGMRGGVSLAAALSIPLYARAGEPFRARAELILLAYVAVIVTLLLPALTLEPLLSHLGLASGEGGLDAVTKARIELVRASLERLEQAEEGDRDGRDDDALRRAREGYELRLAQLRQEAGIEEDADHPAAGEAYRRFKRMAIEGERETLRGMRGSAGLSGEALLELERAIDSEDARLSG